MLEKQHHIAIIVSNWETAKGFYVDKLGFRLIREAYRPEFGDYLRMLSLGETTLEIFEKPAYPQRVSDPDAKGLRHLAFHVEDVEAAVSWLKERGIQAEPIREDRVNGGRFTFFKDPDGLPLEVHE